MKNHVQNATNWTKGQRNIQKLAEKLFTIDSTTSKTERACLIIEKLFWLAVYLTGIVLTGVTCFVLYQQYQKNPVSTTITPLHNKTMNLPNPTICLPFFEPERLVAYFLAGYNNNPFMSTADIVEDKGQYDFVLWPYIEILNDFFDNYTTWKEMQEADWKVPIIYIAQHYLSIIYETETMTQNSKNMLQHLMDYYTGNNVTAAIVEVFVPKMKEWCVTLGEFRDTFGLKFKEFFPITVSYSNGTEFNITTELVFVSKNQVCYNLKTENVGLTVDSNKIRLMLDFQHLMYPQEFGPGVGPEPVAVDISGRARAGSITRDSDSIYLAALTISEFIGYRHSVETILTVNPLIQYVSLPMVKGIQKCSMTETVEACQGQCRNTLIQELCNCSASTLPLEKSFAENGCSIGQYEYCLLNFTGIEDAHCWEQCLDSCTCWQYDVQKTTNNNDGISCAIIDITVTTHNYLLFQEFSVWTLDTIIGILGGALGFWLGIDMLILMYTILTAPIMWFHGKFKQTNKNEMTSESLEQTHKQKKFFGQARDIKDFVFAKWALGKIIWSVLFFIGAGLTIWMFVQLCQQYFGKVTVSTVSVMLNKTMVLPNSAVCQAVQNVAEFKQSEFDAFMNQNNMNKENFLGTGLNQEWPPTLINMAFIYLRAMFILQYNQSYPSTDFHILQLMRNVLLEWSVTDEELEKKFGLEFMKLQNITVICKSSSANESIFLQPIGTIESSPPDMIVLYTWPDLTIEPLSVCLHFPLQSFEFKSVNDYCSISVGSSFPFIDQQISMSKYFLAFESANSYAYGDDVRFDLYSRMDVTFGYSTIYQSIIDCSTYSSPISCLKSCQKEFTTQLCPNCALTSNSIMKNISECNWEWKEYSNCLISAMSFIEQKCADECKFSPCVNPIFTAKTSFLAINLTGDYFQDLVIHFQDFNYALISENLLYSQQDFIAASGGLLGLWLGLDCTYLVAFIFTPFMLLIGKCLKLVTGNDDERQEVEPLGNFSLNGFAKLFCVDTTGKHHALIIKVLFERLFWACIYLLFGAMTLKLILDFFQQYKNAELTSSSVTMSNQTITLPSTTICVPTWYFKTLNEKAVQDLKYIYELPISKLKSEILNSKSKWSGTLWRLSIRYLALFESYKTMEQVNLSTMWNIFNYNYNDTPQFSNSTTAVDVFGTKLELLNITTYDLLQKFGNEQRRLYPVNVTKYVEINGSVGQVLKIDQTTFVSLTSICYALPLDSFSFSSFSDYTIVTSFIPNAECSIAATYLNNTISFDLLGRDTGGSDQYSFERHFSEHSTTGIAVGEVISMLPELNGMQRCSQTTTQEECKSGCRINAIKEQCHCTPFNGQRTNVSTNAISNQCSWSQLKNCLPNFSMTNASNCIVNCLPTCQRIRYAITSSASPILSMKYCTASGCHGEHSFGASNFRYQYYIEQLDWSFFTFVAGLGGTVGILLGIDVLLCIEFCFAMGKWFFAFVVWCKSQKKNKNDGHIEVKQIHFGRSRDIVQVQPKNDPCIVITSF